MYTSVFQSFLMITCMFNDCMKKLVYLIRHYKLKETTVHHCP